MAEKFLNKIAFTDKDNIKWWGYTFPGFQATEPTQKTSVLGSSKLAARGDHSHRTGQLIETSDFLFMKNAERTKLGTYPTTYAQVQQYVTDQILGGTYKGTVDFYADLPTTGLKDGDIYGVLKDTAGGKPSGDYRYHNQTEHPTDPPIATGWYLVSSNRVPVASADYNGLLTSNDFSYIQTIKGTSFQGLIPQGSTVVTGLGGITGTSNLAARADHLHDTRYLMLGGSAQTVTKDVTFSKTITIGAWGTSDIRDTSGNSLLGADATYTYLAKQAGTTLIRSGATDLIHRKNGTDYKLLDASNILALTIQLNGTAQPTYNGLTARTINITPGGIGTYTKAEIDKKVGDVSTDIGSNYLPLSAGTSKPLTGKLIAAKGINLNNCGNVGISFYSTSYVTWVEYMTSAGAGLASTGGAASTFGDVTSWARRSTIEATGGYGWIWDSCANTAGANPDPKMALSSSTGNLRVKGTVTAPTFSGALSGNATTATTLQTTRTLTIGLTGKSFNGGGNVAWSLAEIGALALTGGTVTGLTKFNAGVQIGTVDDIGWYYNGSSVSSRPAITAGTSTARNVNIGSLLVSSAWADGSLVPTNGIYAKGIVHSAAGYYVQGNRIANLNLTRNASMISRWDSFATSATNLPGADTNGGGSVNDGLVNTLFWDGDFGVQIAYDIDGTGIAYRGYTPSTGANKTGWKFLADTAWVKSQLSSGTVASANKLTTPRAINGTNFDGTAAITTALWGTARTLTVGLTGKSVNGSANVAWSLAEIGALPTAGGKMTGNITLANTAAILQEQNTSSNYTRVIQWRPGGNAGAQIGCHNTGGDGTGSISIVPYATSADPWQGAVGLYIAKNTVKIDGAELAKKTDIPTTIAWGSITGAPATATRWPAWSEVTGKPSTFTPTAHNHTLDALNDLQASWDPLLKVAPSAYVTRWPAWSEVTGKPSTFAPSTHTHNTLLSEYGGSGGVIAPGSVGTNKLWCKMMYLNAESSGGGYCDWILMNAYSWSDVPYATAIGVEKVNGVPRAYIMSGPNSTDKSTWKRAQLARIIDIPSLSGGAAATSGQYVSGVTVSGHAITVTKAALPTIPSLSGGAAATSGQYVSGVTVSGHAITVTKAALPTIPTSLKCPYALTIQQNGTSLGSYDGSAAKTINITATSVSLTKASVMAALNTAGTNTFTQYCDFTAGAGNSGSDMRFKKDIKPIGNILDDLMNVEIFTYIWNKKDERNFDTLGVSADQLKENKLFEKLVHERPDEAKTQFVDYDRIGVLALKGLQELNNKVTEENKKLKERVEKLEKILKLVGDKIGVEIDL